MMSLSEWEAELKCSATGKPGELFRTLRRCSLKRSRSRLSVSPMYKQPQRRHMVMGLFGGTQIETNKEEFSAEYHSVDCSGDSKVLTELQIAIRSKLLF